jgi:hypothetical protein
MNIWPGGHFGWIEEHDKLIRDYLTAHEAEWRELTGFRWLFARWRAERRAWNYAADNLKWEHDPNKMY